MQVRKLENAASRDALAECQRRVQTIALIHEKLYQSKDYSRVAFCDYARSLASNVFQAIDASTSKVSLDLAIDNVALAVDKAIPCGLVLNELITNALKHGFTDGRSGSIRVEFARIEDGRFRLAVKDDGVGLPRGFDIATSDSLGLQLVSTLSRQLGAELEVTSREGTFVQLTFPEG
jgi:two-component sensor histidine kinase